MLRSFFFYLNYTIVILTTLKEGVPVAPVDLLDVELLQSAQLLDTLLLS